MTAAPQPHSPERHRWLLFSVAVALGCLSIVGPVGLHLLVEEALRAKMSRVLTQRTGARVTVEKAWPTGILQPGVKAQGVRMDWRSGGAQAGVTVPTVRGYVAFKSLALARVVLKNPRVTGAGKTQGLRQILSRIRRGPSTRTSRSPKNIQKSRLQVEVLGLTARLDIEDGPVHSLVLGPSHFSLGPCGERAQRCHTAQLGGFVLATHHGAVLTGRSLSWRSFDSPSLGARVKKESASAQNQTSRRGFYLDRLQAGRLSLRLPQKMGQVTVGSLLANKRLALTVDTKESGEDLIDLWVNVRLPEKLGGRATVKGLVDLRSGRVDLNAHFQNLPAGVLPLRNSLLSRGRAHIDGDLEVHTGKRTNGSGSATFDVTLQGDTVVSHRLVARHPIPLEGYKLKLAGSARWTPHSWVVELPKSTVSQGKVRAHLRGRIVGGPKGVGANLVAYLPTTPCSGLLEAVPGEAIPKLEGMELGGQLGARLELTAHTSDLDALSLSLKTSGGCRVLADPPEADVHDLLKPYTVKVRNEKGELKPWVLGPKNPHYRRLYQLPHHLLRAFLTTEDRDFYRHQGFDLDQIQRALAYDIENRGFFKGASSISQQLIKNVFLSHHRTLSRKLQEAVLTWRMEQVVPKNRILELYLNRIEMGPGIYGVSQASRVYFRRPVRLLTPLQSLHLAAITPSPVRYYHSFKGGRITMAWLMRLRGLLGHMHRNGLLSTPDYKNMRNRDLVIAAF